MQRGAQVSKGIHTLSQQRNRRHLHGPGRNRLRQAAQRRDRWECEKEGRATALRARGAHPDRTALALDELLTDRQPKAEAAVPALDGALVAAKLTENVLLHG